VKQEVLKEVCCLNVKCFLEIGVMKRKSDEIDRRNFLKAVGAAGLGSVLASSRVKGDPDEPDAADPNAAGKSKKAEFPQVPRRKLGKTGLEVSCLALGGIFNFVENQILLRKALEWGVNYWDTAYSYAGGNSELGIGKFLAKNPNARKKLFIVSKASKANSISDVEERLLTSLKRMNTDYIDLYFGVHGLTDPAAELTDELKQWAEGAKKRKLIRFFGFSTDTNMAQCLAGAAKHDWIDAIMTSCNFRLMQNPEMQAAVETCYKAGIGLVAMKTQAAEEQIETETDKKLTGHFVQRGFTAGQAKIKVVLEDKRISSACVGMQNIALLTSNVAAVLDKTKLAQADRNVFRECAEATCSGYCAGCAYICSAALPEVPYINKIMRYLMYYNSYGDRNRARELFAQQIPADVRERLLSVDYSRAEACCPQRMPIGKLVFEAVRKLA
jgi:predicted aldo/keto reductase-like oxidoreductase